eukprot:3864356-Pyramimonas_sp.AAC.1
MDEGGICAHIARCPRNLISQETPSALDRLGFTENRARELSFAIPPTSFNEDPDMEDPVEAT